MVRKKFGAMFIGVGFACSPAFGLDAKLKQEVQTAFESGDRFLSDGAVLEAVEQGRAEDQLAVCLGKDPRHFGELVDVFDPHYWIEQAGFEWQPLSSPNFQGYVVFQLARIEISHFDATSRAETCPVKVGPLVVDQDGSIVDPSGLHQTILRIVNEQAMFRL